MIEINIIKTQLEKFRRRRMVFNLFLIYLAGLIFLLFIFSMGIMVNKASIARIKKDIQLIENKIAAEQEKFIYIKEREKKAQQLLKNMDIFTEEVRKRVLWSPVLIFTGERVPTGIYLDGFTVKDTPDKNKELIVIISGYILPGITNERETIDRFIRNMSDGYIFSNIFLRDVQKEVRDRTEVLAFHIECRLKQKRGAN